MSEKCTEFRELYDLRKKALESDDIKIVKSALEKFADLWLFADFELNYCNCILDGSWPTAEEILTMSLEKAKQTNK